MVIDVSDVGGTKLPTRLAGVFTLLALIAWTLGGYRAFEQVREALVLVSISGYFDAFNPGGQPRVGLPKDLDTTDPAAIQKLLRERKKARQAARAERTGQLKQRGIVQAASTGTWIVVMVITGFIMLWTALCGLFGARKARKWHRRSAYWIVFATLCTLSGVFVLERWGGFPPPEYGMLLQVLGVQLSYAVAILGGLLLTHRIADS